MLITFEGPDGCGKSSLAKKTYQYFKNKNLSVKLTREPGDNRVLVDHKIRELILSDDLTDANPVTLSLLFAAARNEHLVKLVLPWLEKGELVICDRYIDSSLVYQTIGDDSNSMYDLIKRLNYNVINAPIPDLVIIVFSEYSKVIERQKKSLKKLNYYDKKGEKFFNSVKKKYISLAHNNDNYWIIDNNQSMSKTFEEVLVAVKKVLSKGYGKKAHW